ncbi:MAG: Jag N-terminal domain-containing protein [Oscillospiraceae bacterium]|nr:Jag N-terminal domain-containing protein [Oscillospiraceae bacterium]MBQ5738921.1 Jag N-terminal domain-containing protein [Oscillospiraceae bacterium]
MIKFIDVTGKTEEEAIRKALLELKLERDDVSVEILERAKSGFLGIGSTPATVRVSYDDGQPEVKEEPKVEAKKPVFYQAEVLQKEVRAKEKAQREEKKAEKKQKEQSVVSGEEAQDEKAEAIRSFLKGLLEHMDSEAEARVYEAEKGRYKVILEGEKLGALIGRRGETLDAIQQLTNYAVNHGSEKGRVRIQIDAEGYREKREESLERLAQKVAAKVVKYRRNVTLEPMNAYERHVIHTALQDTANVTTFSIGSEPNRRVVVSFDRTKN